MANKIILTIDKEILKRAKSYSKQTGRSLSELVETYLRTLTAESNEVMLIAPKLKRLVGTIKLPANFDEKKELRAYFENKHFQPGI